MSIQYEDVLSGQPANTLNWRNIVVIAALIFIVVSATYSWRGVVPLYLRELGASDQVIGLVFSVVGLGGAGAAMLAGGLADRFGRRVVLALAFLIAGAFLVVGALSRSWPLAALGITGALVTANVRGPVFQALQAESAPPGRRGMVYGVSETLLMIGLALGPAVGASVLLRRDVPTLLLATTVLMVGEAIIVMVGLREGHHRVVNPAPLAALRLVLRTPALRLALLVNTLLMGLFVLMFGGPIIGLYGADVFGMDKSQLSALLAVATIGGIPTAALGGPLADRLGRRLTISLAVLFYTVCVLVWTQVPVGILNTALLFVGWAGFEMAFPGFLSWVSDIAPTGNLAAIMATLNAAPALVSAMLPVVATLLYARWKMGPFWLSFAMALGLILALAVFGREAGSDVDNRPNQ